jgi:hypothetical protein
MVPVPSVLLVEHLPLRPATRRAEQKFYTSRSGFNKQAAVEDKKRKKKKGNEVDRIRTCAPRGHFLKCSDVVAGKHLNHLITTPQRY